MLRFCAGLIAVVVFALSQAVADPIQGSGSTFVYPLIQRASGEYQVFLSGDGDFTTNDNAVSYEPVGSLGGILRLQRPEIDFAASDYPLSVAELDKAGFAQFPIVAGAIAVVVNIPTLEKTKINMSASVLADIYLGKIQNWIDPAIAKANQGVAFPDLPIAVVARLDGSGSTFNWTSYLSQANTEWREKYGAANLVSWPLGKAVKGGGAVAAEVKATAGAIGYVEFGQAQRAGLNIAMVGLVDGSFSAPDKASISAAINGSDLKAETHFATSLINSKAAGAYPISAVTYAIMRRNSGRAAGHSRALRFFNYVYQHSDQTALDLGFVSLPEAAAKTVNAYWASAFRNGS